MVWLRTPAQQDRTRRAYFLSLPGGLLAKATKSAQTSIYKKENETK